MAQIVTTDGYANPSWLITPAASPSINQKGAPANWLVVLSGIAVVSSFSWENGGEYTIFVQPDISAPVSWAINHYGAPPLPTGATPSLNLEQWALDAAVGSVESTGTVSGGFDVRAIVHSPFETVTDATTQLTFNQIFQGVYVGIFAFASGMTPIRVPYNFTLLAQITSSINVVE
jgi:hypothetical protein